MPISNLGSNATATVLFMVSYSSYTDQCAKKEAHLMVDVAGGAKDEDEEVLSRADSTRSKGVP